MTVAATFQSSWNVRNIFFYFSLHERNSSRRRRPRCMKSMFEIVDTSRAASSALLDESSGGRLETEMEMLLPLAESRCRVLRSYIRAPRRAALRGKCTCLRCIRAESLVSQIRGSRFRSQRSRGAVIRASASLLIGSRGRQVSH